MKLRKLDLLYIRRKETFELFLYCLLIWAGYGNIGGGGGYQQGEDHSDIFTTQSLSFLFLSSLRWCIFLFRGPQPYLHLHSF